MIEQALNSFQLLFFNRELNFGSPKSNILKGNVRINGADFFRLKMAINNVLTLSDWPYLYINTLTKSWGKRDTWNGIFEESFDEPSISLNDNLWTVQLKQETKDTILLRLCLHHCLGDAHSFNLFWNSVYSCYKDENFSQASNFKEVMSGAPLIHGLQDPELVSNLGIGSINRMTFNFNSRIIGLLQPIATKKSGSLMAYFLERLELELKIAERHLELPLQIGIALRNRKNKNQKNSFPTLVNFLPLPKDDNISMQKKIISVFRHQDFSLLDFLKHNNQRIAFNVLFSYQKEDYKYNEELGLDFNFEPSLTDDNIISIHLLEFGDNTITLHVDYRTDLASNFYWKTFIRSIIRKTSADILSITNVKSIYSNALLLPKSQKYNEFWHWFDCAFNDKIALVCGDYSLSFGDLKQRIEAFKFENDSKFIELNPDRSIENIVTLLAAWKMEAAVTYHDKIDDLENKLSGIAYVAKTSGTSGIGKSILISFDSLKTLIADWKVAYNSKESIHLSIADQRFDVFFGDVLRSILSGETLILASEEERLDSGLIAQLIKKHQVSHFESTPSFLSYLLPTLKNDSSLKKIICGSEPILDSFYRLIKNKNFKDITFFNSYGLTECSIDSAISKLRKNEDNRFPSGKVVGDQQISIENTLGELKPMGVWGEIHIRGECVGINIESNNQNKHFSTGDIGMITPLDGLIVGGRLNNDFIKVNGRRIPAGLIQDKVSEIEFVKNCLCFEVDNIAVLFIYGETNEMVVKNSLINVLSKYQLPDSYYFCSNWPINQNGKADRNQLVINYKKEFKSKPSWTPNAESIQKIIHESIVSRNKPFGTASDSLISFGWNSIELLSLGNELNLKGVYVPLTSFIQHPTIEFILNLASEDLKNDCLENPTAEDFDIDDILSILND